MSGVWQYNTSGQNREEDGGRIASKLAAADRGVIARAFVTRTKQGGDRDVTNGSIAHQGYKPGKPWPTSTESPDDITPIVNEARSFPPVQHDKRGAKQVRGKREIRTS